MFCTRFYLEQAFQFDPSGTNLQFCQSLINATKQEAHKSLPEGRIAVTAVIANEDSCMKNHENGKENVETINLKKNYLITK